jgi:hypothetical protein
MQRNTGLILLAGAAALLFLSKKDAGVNNAASQRAALLNWIGANTTDSAETVARVKQVFQTMTDSEIFATWQFVFSYFTKGIQVPEGSTLYAQMQAISSKYNIFT